MAAEAHAQALRAAIEDELATRADILRLEANAKADIQRLEGRISEVKTEFEAKISELKAEIMKYMVAQTFVIVGAVFALMRFVR
jgi:hypothetical protein